MVDTPDFDDFGLMRRHMISGHTEEEKFKQQLNFK
jgi:hypothetical protein